MRLYRVGDEGPAIRDIQDRLAALGFEPNRDTRSVFGDGTRQAVTKFQKAKGLDTDGIVGPDTWRALYEAGFRLGDRIIFMRRPMIRGEDVAELQSRLNSLGFDSGKVDGIYGSETEHAVIDFQHNRNLAEDGRVGPEVVTELHLVTRGEMKEGRQAIREREWLRMLPSTMAGTRIFLDADCRDPDEARDAWNAASAAALAIQEAGGVPVMSRSRDITLPERLRARRANRLGSDLIVAFRINREGHDSVYYFASEHSSSQAGRQLANAIAAALGARVEGRASAMLKETRAPAAVVALDDLSEKSGVSVAEGLEAFFGGERA
ncbi:MAG TPA: peptidoglycan-binding protein [Acidimicrobiia bacterium]|nr:peptidoglycan-binding protein [Acidimicrobiia bacterium]